MPSTVHENFVAKIETEITLQLVRAGIGDSEVEFARNIENLRSATLHLQEFDSDPEFSGGQHTNRSLKVMRKEPDS
jgi:hypothetical protein